MKKFIGLLPAALALVAITSCSNEDFFSNTEEVKYTKTLVVNHEGINSDITRSSMVPGNSNKVVYDANDVIRVYDESVTVYDKYTFDGSKFGTTGTKVSAENAKFALFPSEQVKWGDNDKDPKVAVTIKDEVDLSSVITGTETANGKAYVANIPSWGIVEEGATKDKLLVTLYDMTAIIRVKINHLDANTADRFVKISSAIKNISGVFSATLDKNIATTKENTTTQLAIDNDFVGKKTIYANLGKGELNDVYVYLPIVAGEYNPGDVKVEIVTKGSPDVVLATGATFAANNDDASKRVFVRGGVYNGGTIGVAPEEAVVTSLEDLNNKLKTAATAYSGKTINITVDGEIATSEELYELKIPTTELAAAQVVNINGTIKNKVGNKPLTITGGKAGKAYTINFVDGIEGSENVVVAATCVSPLTLIGTISSTGTDEYHGQIQVNNAAGVTFGNGTAEQSFSTAMPIVVSVAAPIVVNAGEGTIADLTASKASAITVNNGTVTALKSTDATGAAINVKGGTVTTLTAKGSSAAVTVEKGATVATLDASASIAKVDVKAGAKVTTVTTAGDIDVAASIETLTVSKAGATINVTGGARASNGLVTITNLVSDATAAPAVSSTDAAAILNVSKNSGKKDPTFTSTLTDFDKQKTTSIAANGKIYTAAQLAGVTIDKNYTLMTTVSGTIAWKGVNLNGNFDGNGKTINKLTGKSLFNTISGGEVKNLTITTATVDGDDNAVKGGLASEVTGTTTIKGVTIASATVGKGTPNKATATSYGGLIGKVNGTVTLIDNKITNGTVQGYALLGGYIGEVAGGTVKIQTTKAAGSSALKSKISFAQTMGTVAAAEGGKIGNFIGGITGSGVNVTIGATGTSDDAAKDANGLATAGASYACFFDNTAGINTKTTANNLGYDKNTKTVNSVAKKFLGMTEIITVPTPDSNFTLFWEIGYSTGSVNTVSFYNKVPKNDLGVATPLTIANINKFED